MPPASLKRTLRDLLQHSALEDVAELALGTRRVLGTLIALTFDSDPEIGWRAVEAMGMAGQRVAARDPAYVKNHMRKLYWLITEESGAVFWKAPECMAELAARLPELLREFVPIAFHLIETMEEEDLGHFRPAALWAVGRLAQTPGTNLPEVLPRVLEALDNASPQVRGMAAWAVGEVGRGSVLAERDGLAADTGVVYLYRNRILEETTVGAIVRDLLSRSDGETG